MTTMASIPLIHSSKLTEFTAYFSTHSQTKIGEFWKVYMLNYRANVTNQTYLTGMVQKGQPTTYWSLLSL